MSDQEHSDAEVAFASELMKRARDARSTNVLTGEQKTFLIDVIGLDAWVALVGDTLKK